MRRRWLRTLVVAVLVGCLVPTGASAKTVTQLKAELEELKTQTARAGRAFDQAYWRVDEASVRIAKVDKRIAKTKKELATARAVLNDRAVAAYRSDRVSMIDVVLDASSFEQLVTTLEFIQRIGQSDAAAVARAERLDARLKAQRRELLAERRSARKELASLRAQRDKLQSRLRARQAQFLSVKAQLDRARGRAATAGRSAPGPNGMVFPVRGSYYYSDTWGASRSGGRRRHQGTDIMAPTGTPVVALLDGTVRSGSNGLGGKTIWLRAKGWSFYYAHLDGYAVRSGRVSAGQVIGYVGSTGNASGGAPHLHFQMHPGGGGPVNPYPYLRNME